MNHVDPTEDMFERVDEGYGVTYWRNLAWEYLNNQAQLWLDLKVANSRIDELTAWNNNMLLLRQTAHAKHLKAQVEVARAKADADELRWRLEDAEETIKVLQEAEDNLIYWASVDGMADEILIMQSTTPPESFKDTVDFWGSPAPRSNLCSKG